RGLGHSLRRLAAGEPASLRRRRVRFFRRRRKSQQEYQPKSGQGIAAREIGRVDNRRHRWARRRLHRDRCRRVRDCPDGKRRLGDATYRGLSGRHLASARLSSSAEDGVCQVGIHAMRSPAVFLDRDGVLNEATVRDGKPYAPASLEQLKIPEDVPLALARLEAAGYRLVVVTNQPDVARGDQRREVVEAINQALGSRLPLDEFRVCYHDDLDGCDCRKPMPGLLLREPAYDLSRSVMIGDRWRDIEAGQRAGGLATLLIDRGYTANRRAS